MSLRVTIHYPFHPHSGQALEVMLRPRVAGGSVTIIDPSGIPLKVPSWMLSSAAATHCLSATATIAARALLTLANLLPPQLPSPSDPP